MGHKSTCTAMDQFLDNHDCTEQNCCGEDSHTTDQNDEPAREIEAELQQPDHEIEPRIKDDPEDECGYGYSKQVVDGDEEDEDKARQG